MSRGGTTLIVGSGKGHLRFACTASDHHKHVARSHMNIALSCMPPGHAMRRKPVMIWITCTHASTCCTYLLGARSYVTTSFGSQRLVYHTGSTGHYCQHLAIADLFGGSTTLSALVSYPCPCFPMVMYILHRDCMR